MLFSEISKGIFTKLNECLKLCRYFTGKKYFVLGFGLFWDELCKHLCYHQTGILLIHTENQKDETFMYKSKCLI